jgi:hypothetical protein
MPIVYKSIPTEAQWISDTTIRSLGLFTHGRNNPYLHKIDAAIRQYHLSAKTVVPPSESEAAKLTRLRIKVLNLTDIVKKAADWFKTKNMPADNPKMWGGSNRGPYVLALAQYARYEMDSLLRNPSLAGISPGRQPGRQGVGDPMTHAQRVGARTRFAMLKTAVDHNSALGKAGGGAFSGRMVSVEVLAENNPGGVNPRHFEGQSMIGQLTAQGQEHRHLFDYVRQADQALGEIIYLHKNQRWQHQIVIVNGIAHRCVDEHGTPSQSPCAGVSGNFIVSKAGEFYLINNDAMDAQVNAMLGRTTGRGDNFRHTSFTAGEPVLFAGAAEIDAQGKVTVIDTGSGHYKPRLKDLRDVLWLLEAEGVDIRGIQANYHCYVTWNAMQDNRHSMPYIFIDGHPDPRLDISAMMKLPTDILAALESEFKLEVDSKFKDAR